jgi:carboxyl-terminal processing protease
MNNFSKNIFLWVGFTIFWVLLHTTFITFFPFFWGVSHNDSEKSFFNSQKVLEWYSYIEKYYYGFHKKTSTELEDAFMSSMAQSLGDKYSTYFSPTESNKFKDTLQWDFEWIGAVVWENKKWVVASKIISGSPAEKYGLHDGDIITHVDGVHIAGMSSSEAVDLIRGPKGTSVKLRVIRITTEKEEDITIKRWVVVVPTTISRIFTGSTSTGATVWYLELALFGENSAKEFQKEIFSLSASGSKWIIIDLRQNGGGFLDAAIDILSYFFKENTIGIITKGNTPADNVTYFTSKKAIQNLNIPLVVLVDELSASASEILAGALQDYDRAVIIWEKTYGKGSVQSPFILSDGSMMKITTAKWFTPKDRSIDGKGITPDILISFQQEDIKNRYDRQLEGAKKILQDMVDHKKSVQTIRNEYKDIKF